MKIAVTSQNFRTVTGHAGKTRRFLIFEAGADGGVREVDRLDLPKGMAFHDFHGDGPHPVDGVDVIITQGAGHGFTRRMNGRGIRVAVTTESDPAAAAAAFLDGTLKEAPPQQGHSHNH